MGSHLNNFKWVVFDLDNTLFPESSYFKIILTEFAKKNHIPLSEFEDIFNNFDCYRATKPNIFKFILMEINRYSDENYERLFDLYTTLKLAIEPYEGVQKGINNLLKKGFKLGVITNGVIDSQRNKWQSLNLENKDLIYFKPAREFGADKPNNQSFDSFMDELKADYTRTIFVGDKYKNDIEYPESRGGLGMLIDEQKTDNYSGMRFNNTSEAISQILQMKD